MNTQVDVRSNGLDKECGDLFIPFVSQPHVVYFSGIPVQGIKDNSVTAIELSDTTQNGKLESCGAVVLSHLLAANTSVTSVRDRAAHAAYFAPKFENSELCVPNFQWLCPSCFPETHRSMYPRTRSGLKEAKRWPQLCRRTPPSQR